MQLGSSLRRDASAMRADAAAYAPPHRSGAAISLSQLKKQFGALGAVNSVSLEIGAGDFVSFVGPSGSGKTTTLMMIAGFIMPTEGEILIDGQPIVRLPPYRRNIGMVFQSYALFPHMTVAENIAFPLRQRRHSKADIAREVAGALDLIRLPDYGDRYPRQLSGGQQQRVALARALVFKPPVLLMDEPLGALDKQLREEMQFEIRRLHADLGITCVYVTHDQEEALTMSTHVAVMRQGRVEQIGTPEELYERPSNAFVASFLGESSFFSGTVARTVGDLVEVRVGDFALRAVSQAPVATGAAVTLATRPQKMRIVHTAVVRPVDRMNLVRGTVQEAVFTGESWRFVIDTGLSSPLILRQLQRHDLRPPLPGESVMVEWHLEDTILL